MKTNPQANQPTNNLSYSLNRPQANLSNRQSNLLKRYLNRIAKDNNSIILHDKEPNQNEKSF